MKGCVMKTIKIGEVGVDSGTILVTDPCYIKDDYNYEEIVKPVLGENLYGQTNGDLSFITTSGLGDGVYPIYANIIEDETWGRRVESIMIQFIFDIDVEPDWLDK